MAKRTTGAEIKEKAQTAAKAAAKARKKVEHVVEEAVEDAGNAAQKAGKKIRQSAERAMGNAAKLNARVIDHAEENAKEAFAAMRKIAQSKDVKDIVRVQASFVKEQSARSVAQVKEVGEMIASFGRTALDGLKPKK
ncbi:phasin family protein [Chakrabartia godavariana]|nr:phasin family protein [Chakrabartia godavariana]